MLHRYKNYFLSLIVLACFVFGGCPTNPVHPGTTQVEFRAMPTSGTSPLTVQFTDLSTSDSSAINYWYWDFGDGQSDIVKNPSHVYEAAGVYTVTLTVSAKGAQKTMTKADYITVTSDSAIQQTVDDFLSPDIPAGNAVQNLSDKFEQAVTERGVDSAVAELDAALAGALNTPDDLVNLMRRSDEAGGMILAARTATTKSSKIGPDVCEKTTVIFVNGMNVVYPLFVAERDLLADRLRTFVGADEYLKYDVTGVYNRSATDEQFSLWGAYICPLVSMVSAAGAGGSVNTLFPLVRAQVQKICTDGGGFFIDLVEAGTQALVTQWADFYPPSAVADASKLGRFVEDEVRRGRKVVIVSHSQGNFFARDAVNALGADAFGSYADSVAVVQVASPVNSANPIRTETVRIDHCRDFVSSLSLLLDPGACYITPMASGTLLPPLGLWDHPFELYLQSAASTQILGSISHYNNTLSNPRAHGTLKVTDETHATPAAVKLSASQSSQVLTVSDARNMILAPGEILAWDCPLQWLAASDDGRVSVTPARSSGAGELQTNVTISAMDTSKIFDTTLRFTNENDPLDSFILPVHVRTNDHALIGLDKALVRLTDASPTEILTISPRETIAGVLLRWEATSNDARVTISPNHSDGTLGNETRMTISTTDTSVAFNAAISFLNLDEPGDTPAVPVAVGKEATPRHIKVSTNEIELYPDISSQQLTVYSEESGVELPPLRWSATSTWPYIYVSPSVFTGNSTGVTISSPIGGSAHSAIVTFTNLDDPADVEVVSVDVKPLDSVYYDPVDEVPESQWMKDFGNRTYSVNRSAMLIQFGKSAHMEWPAEPIGYWCPFSCEGSEPSPWIDGTVSGSISYDGELTLHLTRVENFGPNPQSPEGCNFDCLQTMANCTRVTEVDFLLDEFRRDGSGLVVWARGDGVGFTVHCHGGVVDHGGWSIVEVTGEAAQPLAAADSMPGVSNR